MEPLGHTRIGLDAKRIAHAYGEEERGHEVALSIRRWEDDFCQKDMDMNIRNLTEEHNIVDKDCAKYRSKLREEDNVHTPWMTDERIDFAFYNRILRFSHLPRLYFHRHEI
jgi:hypothetical protein